MEGSEDSTLTVADSRWTVPNHDSTVLPSKQAFEMHNNTIPGLVVISLGIMTPEGAKIIDIDEDPWRNLPHESCKPKLHLLHAKVLCCYKVMSLAISQPCSSIWPTEKCLNLLNKFPVTNPDKIEFLKSEIEERKKVQEEANSAKEQECQLLDNK